MAYLFNKIKWGDNLSVTDEGGGVIRVDSSGGGGGGTTYPVFQCGSFNPNAYCTTQTITTATDTTVDLNNSQGATLGDGWIAETDTTGNVLRITDYATAGSYKNPGLIIVYHVLFADAFSSYKRTWIQPSGTGSLYIAGMQFAVSDYIPFQDTSSAMKYLSVTMAISPFMTAGQYVDLTFKVRQESGVSRDIQAQVNVFLPLSSDGDLPR